MRDFDQINSGDQGAAIDKIVNGQSKRGSLVETITGLIIGFTIAWASWIFPVPQLFDLEASRGQAIGVTLYFTILSFLRGYGVRRMFNFLHTKFNFGAK